MDFGKVICINSTAWPFTPPLIEGKTYHVSAVNRKAERYMFFGQKGSYPMSRFIPASVEFEIENEIFEILKN